MFNRTVVHKALKHTMVLDSPTKLIPENIVKTQSSLISQLIYDIFGGKILKTRWKNGWHFYNWIDGERIDFTKSEINKTTEYNSFEDLPSTPAETRNYFEQEDYSNFFLKFIWAFEETVVT